MDDGSYRSESQKDQQEVEENLERSWTHVTIVCKTETPDSFQGGLRLSLGEQGT